LRIFLVFAELSGDPDDPVSVKGWEAGELPPDPGYLFDYQITPGQEPEGVITRYYNQASFGRYIVLADYYPEMISINFNQVKGNGFQQVIDTVKKHNPVDIITRHGFSVNNGDFDLLSTSSYGMPKPREPDSFIDMVMVIWRVNSKITTTNSAGFCSPYKRNYSIGEMKGMNSHSTFVMKSYTAYTIVRHEFSHLLLGGNNFHTGGSGAGTKTFMSSAGGYAMLSSWDKNSPVYSAFDRRRLGWKHPDHRYQISARDPLTGKELDADLLYSQEFDHGSNEFLLRDFVETGDAIRIELPYLRVSSDRINKQWLWLENHQRLEGNIDHESAVRKGVYAYIQVGKEDLSGSSTYGGNCNYTWPLSSFGNYDYILDEVKEEAQTRDDLSNPFTGYNNLIRGAFDLGEKDGVIFRDELFTPKKILVNGIEPDPSQFNFETYPVFGSSLDAFLTGDKIGIDRNPAAVPLLTFQTTNRRSTSPRSPAGSDNRIIHLNGISIEFLEELPDGSMRLNIRWDARTLERNVRWCGDIHLQEDLLLEKKVQLRLDYGLTPQKPGAPVRINGEDIFADSSSFTLNEGSHIKMNTKSILKLENKSSLILKAGSQISMERRAGIYIPDSCGLIIQPGASISGKRRIYLSEGARVEIPDGSVEVRVKNHLP
jgi:hypothetical protein